MIPVVRGQASHLTAMCILSIALLASCSSSPRPATGTLTPPGEMEYVHAMRPFDGTSTAHDLLTVGYGFCSQLEHFGAPSELVEGDYQNLVDNLTLVVPKAQAAAEVAAAITDLCPNYKHILPH